MEPEHNTVHDPVSEPGQPIAGRQINNQTAIRLAKTFKALSDPTRVRIISLLLDQELCVFDLATALGISQSAVSHQLRILRDLWLVRWRREGRQIFYTLDDEHVADLYWCALNHVLHERQRE
ncbi:MAG: ArsR/SmtB family transcription factor [Anaerolineae bacterium]